MGREIGACGRIGQVVLVIVNIIFGILGLAILVSGALLKFKENLVNGYVSDFLRQIQLQHLETDLVSVISTVAIICICVGVFVFLLSMFGCCGACCQQKILLTSYAIVVLLILGAQIAAIVLTFQYKDEWQGSVKSEMKNVIKDKYNGDNGTDIISMGINAAFMEFDCCGVDNYKDVELATGWVRTYMIDNQEVTFKAPYFCCKNVDTETPKVDSGLFTSVNQTECATDPTNENSNYKKGCFDALEDIVMRYNAIYIGVGIALMLLEIFCVIFACFICCKGREPEGKYV